MVQLCGAVIGWASDKSSRKNVFQVTEAAVSCDHHVTDLVDLRRHLDVKRPLPAEMKR